jgi:hypothetical protein
LRLANLQEAADALFAHPGEVLSEHVEQVRRPRQPHEMTDGVVLLEGPADPLLDIRELPRALRRILREAGDGQGERLAG